MTPKDKALIERIWPVTDAVREASAALTETLIGDADEYADETSAGLEKYLNHLRRRDEREPEHGIH
jgi:hypothetical protein